MIRSAPPKATSILAPAMPSAEQGDGGYRALFHLGLWGGAAAACLLVAAIATRTETGRVRFAAAYAALTGTSDRDKQQSATRERERQEARRVTEAIRSLTGDRDSLLARMTALERNYEDVTGSIGKLANAAKPPAELSPAASTPPPDTSAPATAPVAAPAAAAADATPEPVATKAEFGVDIGGASTIAALRTAWDRARASHSALLDGLRPLIAVRDRRGQVELRLVVGPIGNAAAAAKLCAALATAGLSCQPTMFEGQRLASR